MPTWFVALGKLQSIWFETLMKYFSFMPLSDGDILYRTITGPLGKPHGIALMSNMISRTTSTTPTMPLGP
jgi:hypothetical protein